MTSPLRWRGLGVGIQFRVLVKYYFCVEYLKFMILVSFSFSFACPKENETKEKGTTVKDTFPR